MNNKGFLSVELIISSVICFAVCFFLLDLTVKFVDKTDNLYKDIDLITARSLIIKNVRSEIKRGIKTSGKITSVNCISNNCTIILNNSVNNYLYIEDGSIKYSENNKSNVIYQKKIDSSLSDISLTSLNKNNYYNFKLSGKNIFMDKRYDANIIISNN